MNAMTPDAEIRRRIQQAGPITFAEFMEVALFWPQGGYYLAAEPFGPSGDYYTSPLAHPAFGALLAVQLFQMWRVMDRPVPFTVVEQGAGNGMLCWNIVAYSRHLPPEFQQALRYVCLDRRTGRGSEAAVGASRIASAGVPLRGIRGCFLSNEFLDAFPVHQVRMHQGRLQEVYVTLQNASFVETLAEPSTPALAQRLDHLGVTLAEGQTAEINLGLDGWAEEVSAALDAGFVLTIDYGQTAADLYSAERRFRGTLTTYYRHVQTDAPLQRVGRQDMSAQVDFTSVVDAGKGVGLEPQGFTTQRHFLNNLGLERHFLGRLPSLNLPARELQANRRGLRDLVNPHGLGDFKVLLQGKGVEQPQEWGLEPSKEVDELLARLPVPLLTTQHMPPAAGPYPQVEYEVTLEELWPRDDEPGG
jgi:SAM-dependent MidA family methyltransferase